MPDTVNWQLIESKLTFRDEAYKLAVGAGFNSDVGQINVIKLMGRTGICVEELSESTIIIVLDWCIKVLC